MTGQQEPLSSETGQDLQLSRHTLSKPSKKTDRDEKGSYQVQGTGPSESRCSTSLEHVLPRSLHHRRLLLVNFA